MKIENKEEDPTTGSPTHPPEPGNARDKATSPMSNSQAAHAPGNPITPIVNPLMSAHDNTFVAKGPATSPASTTSPSTHPGPFAWEHHVPAPAQPPAPAPVADPFTPSHILEIAQDLQKFVETPDKEPEVSSSEFRSVISAAKQDLAWKTLAESLENEYAGSSVSGSKFRMEKGSMAVWILLRARFKSSTTASPSQASSRSARQSSAEQEIPDEQLEVSEHWESQAAKKSNAEGEEAFDLPIEEGGDHRELQIFLNWRDVFKVVGMTFAQWCLLRMRMRPHERKLAVELDSGDAPPRPTTEEDVGSNELQRILDHRAQLEPDEHTLITVGELTQVFMMAIPYSAKIESVDLNTFEKILFPTVLFRKKDTQGRISLPAEHIEAFEEMISELLDLRKEQGPCARQAALERTMVEGVMPVARQLIPKVKEVAQALGVELTDRAAQEYLCISEARSAHARWLEIPEKRMAAGLAWDFEELRGRWYAS